MKKSNLTAAVVAGLVGTAGLVSVSNAVNLNPDGVGQVLIYPYYTIENGLITTISVVNTTDQVKAVKVRFLEGRNSQEVLDFNLYMSPFDVWTGVVTEAVDGTNAARLITADTSCTVPIIPATGLRFQNFEYAFNRKDAGPYDLGRTRAGHLEMIEMGSVINPPRRTAAIHVGGSATAPARPPGCQLLVDSFRTVDGVQGYWEADPRIGIASPDGGLFGGAMMVNVGEGTVLTYNADALQGFYTRSGDLLNLHTNPGEVEPSLNSAENEPGLATAVIFDPRTDSQVVTLDFTSGSPNAVTAVFMHNEIYNEYAVGGSAALSSEWVITHPTKRLHITQATVEGRRPFTDTYRAVGGVVRGACEPIRVAFWDREERDSRSTQGSTNVCPSPLPPEGCNPESDVPGTNLCWEANIFTFNQFARRSAGEPSAILGATYYENFETSPVFGPDGLPGTTERFGAGWARLNFFVQDENQADGISIHRMLSLPEAGGFNMIEGLPVTGFWAVKGTNANAQPGLLAQYSGLFHHRGDRVGYTVQVDGAGVIDPQDFQFLWS
jgi:hypothetical protein